MIYTAQTPGYDRRNWNDNREVIELPDLGKEKNTLACRREKISKYREWWWMDGSVTINSLPDVGNADMVIFAHPIGRCLYKEAAICMRHGKESKEKLQRQIDHYRSLGMPENFGLLMTGIMYRKKSMQMDDFMREWWHHVETYSMRDQVSLPFLLWKRIQHDDLLIKILPFDRNIKIASHNIR